MKKPVKDLTIEEWEHLETLCNSMDDCIGCICEDMPVCPHDIAGTLNVFKHLGKEEIDPTTLKKEEK